MDRAARLPAAWSVPPPPCAASAARRTISAGDGERGVGGCGDGAGEGSGADGHDERRQQFYYTEHVLWCFCIHIAYWGNIFNLASIIDKLINKTETSCYSISIAGKCAGRKSSEIDPSNRDPQVKLQSQVW
uniref:Uncharacterized protein n=1 Tax=Setaria viridis TaxID=4556 RepID=A0A4U6W7D5_SETVI|nr:hypothetical protein SEVIR_1G124300v2 [Setaria viridis]